MPGGDTLDDDYVASLLKRDAEANKNRYLTSGLGSLLSRKPKSNAPKPNTRFLRNIIRETDSHNAALKAKEEQESRARLKELRREEASGKRRRDEDNEDSKRAGKRRTRDEDRPHRWANALGGLSKRPEDRDSKRASCLGHTEGNERTSSRDRRRDRSREHRHRRRHTVPEPLSPSSTRSPERRTKRRRRTSSGSDSDPLNDIIGPAPPPKIRARGRGAISNSSMDARFKQDYDPKADVSVDQDEDDDWDMALEALRDRTKWKQQGAERLKAAGFTDDEVSKWQGDGREKDVDDVRWRKKGEGREWDRGKVMDGEGGAVGKAEWTKLVET